MIPHSLSPHRPRLGRCTVDNLLRDYHASIARGVLGDAFMWEVWAEEGDESPGNGCTKGAADCAGAGVRHPVA